MVNGCEYSTCFSFIRSAFTRKSRSSFCFSGGATALNSLFSPHRVCFFFSPPIDAAARFCRDSSIELAAREPCPATSELFRLRRPSRSLGSFLYYIFREDAVTRDFHFIHKTMITLLRSIKKGIKKLRKIIIFRFPVRLAARDSLMVNYEKQASIWQLAGFIQLGSVKFIFLSHLVARPCIMDGSRVQTTTNAAPREPRTQKLQRACTFYARALLFFLLPPFFLRNLANYENLNQTREFKKRVAVSGAKCPPPAITIYPFFTFRKEDSRQSVAAANLRGASQGVTIPNYGGGLVRCLSFTTLLLSLLDHFFFEIPQL